MSRPSGGAGAVLQVQPFRRYLLGQTLSAFGDSLMPIALVFAVLAEDGAAASVGWVLLASRLPAIVLALLGGAIGDRAERRRVLLLTDAGRCLLQTSTAVLLLTGHAPLWMLAVLQALAGTASALFLPAAAGLVRTLTPPGLLAQANALLGLTRSTVSLAGLALAGALVSTVGPGWAFALDAATFATSAAFLARLPRLPAPAVPEPLWRSALHGLAETARRRWLWTSIVYVATLNLVAICPFLVLGPVIAQRQLGGAAAWSTIALGYATGSICGSALVLRWRPLYPLRTAFLGALGLIPFLCLLGDAAPIPVLVATAAVAGLQAAMFNVLHQSALQSCVPEQLVSRVTSVNQLGSLAAVPLGLALAGPVAQATSPRTVLNAAAALAGAATLAVLCLRDVRDLTGPARAGHPPPVTESRQPSDQGSTRNRVFTLRSTRRAPSPVCTVPVIRLARVVDLPHLQELERAAESAFLDLDMGSVAHDDPPCMAVLDSYRRDGRAWVATEGADHPVAPVTAWAVRSWTPRRRGRHSMT